MLAVQVVIEAVPDQLFTYSVPEEWVPRVRLGQCVQVPFGRRMATGYIVEVAEAPDVAALSALPLFGGESKSESGYTLRPMIQLMGDEPVVSPKVLELTKFLASYYCVPLASALRCAVPAPVRVGRSKPKELYFVSLVKDKAPEKLTDKQQALYANLLRVDGGWLNALTREFACSSGMFYTLERYGLLRIEKQQQQRMPLERRKVLPTAPLALTSEQADALKMIREQVDNPPTGSATIQPILLFGVTGSGKTEVYLQAIEHVLRQGGGAIVLVPEIALTPQAVQRFTARFESGVAVLHSALSDGERYDEWHRIRRGEARIVVGPRSAVFAPVVNLKLLVVDEEHEPSYKQEELPHYHARDMALMRGRLEGAAVVLGTATPSLETWYNVRRGKFVLAALSQRVTGHPLPEVRIIDMRSAAQQSGQAQLFSEELIEAMRQRLDRGEQIILFLNRRGFSSSVQCPACGTAVECSQCSIAMTYHHVGDCLRCHICGEWQHTPKACPHCESPTVRFAGFGTQKIESVLSKLLPKAKILRLDADVTARKGSHDVILGEFQSGQANVLIGTQMLAKGHHFPNVTLVGVLAADMSLHQPDFRASERTFHLLTQVSGRAGRGEVPGEVFIQTYTPDHAAVVHAVNADFETFADGELLERKACGFPPFVHLAVITFAGASERTVQAVAQRCARFLQSLQAKGLLVSEAVPAPLAKAKMVYRYQLMLRHPQPKALAEVIRLVRVQFPPSQAVTIAVDIDAMSLN